MHLFEVVWKILVVRYGRDTSTVLGKLMKTSFEFIKSCNSKEIHLSPWNFLQGIKYIAKSKTERHVTVEVERERERERERGGGGAEGERA